MEAKNSDHAAKIRTSIKDPNNAFCSGELDAWLFLIRDRRWSQIQKRALIDNFDDPQTIYAQPTNSIRRVINGRYRSSDPKVSNHALKEDKEWLSFDGNHLITINSPHYPDSLREISDPPIALFAIGNLASLADPIIALVGSRRPSPVGSKIANDMARELAKLGVSITSGLALGIDAMAHQACIGAGGQTIAVMACGLDIVYPARHRKLFAEVIANGCVVSEYPLGSTPTKYNFPQRNRIVSGLSLGVIIVEAAERSGTLITARLAAEQDRQVMVVPGSALSSQYRGSHRLLRQGAALVCTVDDVLFELANALAGSLKQTAAQEVSHAKPKERDMHPILDYLSDQSSSVDEIVRLSGLSAAEVSSLLLMLEVDGLIATANDGGYVRLV